MCWHCSLRLDNGAYCVITKRLYNEYNEYIMVWTMWKVITTDRFDQWFFEQEPDLQDELLAAFLVLKREGPLTGRPLVDTLKNSKYPNMKELRLSFEGKPIRALFAFDPIRQAVFLCAGDKTGDKKFYQTYIKIADREFKIHLKKLEDK